MLKSEKFVVETITSSGITVLP